MVQSPFLLVRPKAIACGADLSFTSDVFFIFFSPPENDSFRKDLCFTHDVFFISPPVSDSLRKRT